MLTPYISKEIIPTYSKHPQAIKDQCIKFADEIVLQKKKFYLQDRNADPNRLKHQIYIGKLGEFFAESYMRHYFNLPPVKPDTKIYSTNQTKMIGHNADLYYPAPVNLELHVKTYSDNGFPESYMFEINCPLINQPSAYSSGEDNKQIVLIKVSEYGAAMRAILNPQDVIGLLRDPIKKNLRKRVLYFEDLNKEKALAG